MTELERMGEQAVKAKYALAGLTEEKKNEALFLAADMLKKRLDKILSANREDLEAGRQRGMSAGLLDRLTLNESRIGAMAEGLSQIAVLPDPVGEDLDTFTRPNGLVITKRRVPLGVIGIIYESRPNVTADAFGLCFKAGNAALLKGGKEALSSNRAIESAIREALEEAGVTPDAIQLVKSSDRAVTNELMRLNRYVDVLIPRGGAGLIRAVVENSTVPVIETGTGNCHVYVDEDADLTMAVNIVKNAKTQRISVCNACESLVVHEKIAGTFLPMLASALQEKQVELRADEAAIRFLPDALPASEADFGTEYLDYILSVKTVGSVKEAIDHINRCSTGHSETIVTRDEAHAEAFLNGVDSACVYLNASTRFTDGFEFGFGAEIGISTQKLHARGPMGLKELTSYKYQIRGNGQIRS